MQINDRISIALLFPKIQNMLRYIFHDSIGRLTNTENSIILNTEVARLLVVSSRVSMLSAP